MGHQTPDKLCSVNKCIIASKTRINKTHRDKSLPRDHVSLVVLITGASPGGGFARLLAVRFLRFLAHDGGGGVDAFEDNFLERFPIAEAFDGV